jgi:hypothetical protein
MPRSIPLLLLILLATLFYHGALAWEVGSPWLVALSSAALCGMVQAKTARRAFYAGIGAALLIIGPHLWFLLEIFHAMALILWLSIAKPVLASLCCWLHSFGWG